MTRFLSISPILTSYNLDATESFYGQLGFVTSGKYPDYLIVTRDGISLHFGLRQGRPEDTQTECYLYVEQIDAFYQQCQAADGVHPNSRLETKPWGVREFALRDRDFNVIRVGER